MDPFWKALDDPTRRRILELLRMGPMAAGDIASHFPISGASISHHLNVLVAADLAVRARSGQFIHYELNPVSIQQAVDWLLVLKGETDA
jgi:DNA-binding transcriptional ArsR family regulator